LPISCDRGGRGRDGLARMGGKRKNLSDWMRAHVWLRDQFTCQYCGASPKTPGYRPHIHHIIPVARQGTNDAANLVCACEDCNLAIGTDIVEPRLRKPIEVVAEPDPLLKLLEPARCTCKETRPILDGWDPQIFFRPFFQAEFDPFGTRQGRVEFEYDPFSVVRM